MNFCTLFDSNYLSRGLVMFNSLKNVCTDFHLYVLAFDELTEKVLSELEDTSLTVISLNEFENEELLQLKTERTIAEYCWTCTPSLLYYCLQELHLDHCIYLDADLCFYQDPQVLLGEDPDASVMITPHWYSHDADYSHTSGIYCVQFVYIKSDDAGMKVAKWWKDACINWCYARYEEGKFGDQKYLDSWPYMFEGVHVIQNQGGGVAPWNQNRYQFSKSDGSIGFEDKHDPSTKFTLIFFHFHGLKFLSQKEVVLTNENYEITEFIKQLIYFPYIALLLENEWNFVKIKNTTFPGSRDSEWIKRYTFRIKQSLKELIKALLGMSNTNRVHRHHISKISDKWQN